MEDKKDKAKIAKQTAAPVGISAALHWVYYEWGQELGIHESEFNELVNGLSLATVSAGAVISYIVIKLAAKKFPKLNILVGCRQVIKDEDEKEK